ncbi:MAG: hypothetical protein ABW116_05615, partial [Candidatus Sedimenticola sp. 20ELBAFRAG]
MCGKSEGHDENPGGSTSRCKRRRAAERSDADPEGASRTAASNSLRARHTEKPAMSGFFCVASPKAMMRTPGV